jgi:hypothetical protein
MAAAGVLVVALYTSVCGLQDTWLPPHFGTLAGPDRVDGYATMEAAAIYNTTVSHFTLSTTQAVWLLGCCMATMRGGFVLSRARVMLTRSMLNMNSAFFVCLANRSNAFLVWGLRGRMVQGCMGWGDMSCTTPVFGTTRKGGWRGSTQTSALPAPFAPCGIPTGQIQISPSDSCTVLPSQLNLAKRNHASWPCRLHKSVAQRLPLECVVVHHACTLRSFCGPLLGNRIPVSFPQATD